MHRDGVVDKNGFLADHFLRTREVPVSRPKDRYGRLSVTGVLCVRDEIYVQNRNS